MQGPVRQTGPTGLCNFAGCGRVSRPCHLHGSFDLLLDPFVNRYPRARFAADGHIGSSIGVQIADPDLHTRANAVTWGADGVLTELAGFAVPGVIEQHGRILAARVVATVRPDALARDQLGLATSTNRSRGLCPK